MNYNVVRNRLITSLTARPTSVDGQSVILASLALTALLFVVVPVVAVVTGLHLLALVVIAGLIYAAGLVYTDTLFEGMFGSVIVLCTIQSNFPITGVERGGRLGIYHVNILLVDTVAVPLAIMFLLWGGIQLRSRPIRSETIAGYALLGLVAWSAIAAVASDGPSTVMGLFFALTQLRNLLLFGVAVVIGQYIGIRSAVYSLLIAVGGNMLFAVAEALNRGSFGLTYIGDARGRAIEFFTIGPLQFVASTYAGGLASQSRILVALMLLVVPVTIERLVRGPNWQRVLSVGYLFVSVFLIRVSATDSGWMAFLLLTVLVIGVLVYLGSRSNDSQSGMFDYALGIAMSIGAALFSYFIFTSNERIERQAVNPSTSGEPTGGSGAVSINTDQIISLLEAVPFVNIGNLSIRLQQYVIALDIGFSRPLFGVGGMNFSLVAESYGLPRPISMHNIYLSYLAGTGIPGVLLFITSLVAVLVVTVKKAVTATVEDRLLWAMVACGMLSFHAINFWIAAGEIAEVTYMTFWVLAGCVVGSART